MIVRIIYTFMLNFILASGYFNLANILYSSGDYLSAIENYTQAILLNPEDVTSYLGRGMARSLTKDYQSAMFKFDYFRSKTGGYSTMDYTQLERYRQVIETTLSEYASLPYSYANIQSEVVFDRNRDRYLWMDVGWDGECLRHATRSPHSWLSGAY